MLEQLHTQKELLMSQNSLKVKVIGIADVANFILDRNGIDLTCYNELLKKGTPSTPEKLKNALIDLNIYNCVFVDCTASPAIAGIYKDLLLHNISVVAANKIAASGDYDNYMELKQIARKKGIKYLFETNVGAGLPIINTINELSITAGMMRTRFFLHPGETLRQPSALIFSASAAAAGMMNARFRSSMPVALSMAEARASTVAM